VVALAAALFALTLVFATSDASAQSAFCQQYPNDPSCQGDIGPTGGDDVLLPFGDATGGPTGATDGVGSGELPFTGYPLPGLLLLMLLLLALGIALRTAVAARERMRARHALAVAKSAAA
jgi:hypothetical protein